jgi:hypothetical protein
MRVTGIALAVVGLLTAFAASASDSPPDTGGRQTWTVDAVSPGQLMEIRLLTGAGLRITTWDRNQVSVETDWTEVRCPDARISLSRTGSGALLESRYPEDGPQEHNCSFSVEVRVPRRFDVRIRSAGGGVEVTGLDGSVTGLTGGGRILLSRMTGEVRLRTGGGEIRVRDSDLEGSLTTGGGRISFENVSGPITARSGSVRGTVRGRSSAT